jgi:hypothetical protein
VPVTEVREGKQRLPDLEIDSLESTLIVCTHPKNGKETTSKEGGKGQGKK